MNATNLASFDLAAHGITVTEVHHNLRPNALHEHAIRFEKDASSWIRDYCERVWKLRPASVAG